jgi:hypothetical protein
MTQKDLLQMHFDLLNLQVGDQVQITHRVPNEYLGVDYVWSTDMCRHIGSIYKVTEVVDDHIRLDGSASSWSWHPACMKVVYRKPKATSITFGVDNDGINPEFVAMIESDKTIISINGGNELVTIDFNTVELIFKHMNKLSGKMLLTRGEE